MKNNLGVTMIELVVVIVIVLMIATFAINSGKDTLTETDVTEVLVEMTSVKNALKALALKQEVTENFQISKGELYDEEFISATGVSYGDNVLGNQQDWYIIYGIDVDDVDLYKNSKARENLGLESLNHTYIINFKESDVELYRPVTLENRKVRTYDEVRELAEK